MDQTNLIDYLKTADKHNEKEKQRVENILTWDVGQQVLKTFRKEMLVKPQAQLLNKGSGFKDFIAQSQHEHIKLLYKLYSQEPECLKPIGEQFKNYISVQGTNTIKSVPIATPEGKNLSIKEILSRSQIVEKLLKMLEEYLQIVKYCFQGNSSFEIMRAQGFEHFINLDLGEFTLAEVLATYSDQILRKNGLKMPED